MKNPFFKEIVKNGSKNYSLFFCAIIVFFLFKVVVSNHYSVIFEDTAENCVFALILVVIVSLSNSNKWIRIFLWQFFIATLFLETAYFYLFDVPISASALFIFFETNSQESNEFIVTKFDYKLGLLLLLYITLAVVSYVYDGKLIKRMVMKRSYGLSLISFLVLFLKISWLINHNFPYAFARALYRYAKESTVATQFSNPVPDDKLCVVKDVFPNDSQSHIIVIGESTNRAHFSLYGEYDRVTTPKLEEIKENLIVYDNVISPHSSTTTSLVKVLTRDNYEKSYKNKNISIVQLLNKAGYKTYWLSNQRPLGVWSTIITKIAKAADSSRFYNSEHTGSAKQHDGIVVKALNKLSISKSEKAIIFIHLLGTHTDYKNRYPEMYDKFHGNLMGKTPRQSQFINEYDNAVLYNDNIVATIIEIAKSKGFSSMLYFSDHGEEVYNTVNFHGHVADTDVGSKLSKDLFEIPFILWGSDQLKARKDLYFKNDRIYMIDDLFHSIGHLIGLESSIIDKKRSIFSTSFLPRKRMVGRGLHFDTELE